MDISKLSGNRGISATLILLLILLELILSAIFLTLGYLTGNAYIRGVGVGLLISWVTSGLAYLAVRKQIRRGLR